MCSYYVYIILFSVFHIDALLFVIIIDVTNVHERDQFPECVSAPWQVNRPPGAKKKPESGGLGTPFAYLPEGLYCRRRQYDGVVVY